MLAVHAGGAVGAALAAHATRAAALLTHWLRLKLLPEGGFYEPCSPVYSTLSLAALLNLCDCLPDEQVTSRGLTLRARWVTRRARWVTLRAPLASLPGARERAAVCAHGVEAPREFPGEPRNRPCSDPST